MTTERGAVVWCVVTPIRKDPDKVDVISNLGPISLLNTDSKVAKVLAKMFGACHWWSCRGGTD